MNSDARFGLSDRRKLEALTIGLRQVQFDWSLPQLIALLQIALEPGLSVNELADRIGVSQQTASRYVAALLGRYQDVTNAAEAVRGDRSKLDPLINQTISQVDPRRRALFISGDGQALLKRVLSKLT